MAKKGSFFNQLVKDMADESVSIAADGTSSAEFSGFIDTGSYAFNAVLSGSIYDGLPDNKVLGLGGDPQTGKTYFALGILRHFLDTRPDSGGVIFETEGATTKSMLAGRGISPDRVVLAEPATVEEFRTKALKMLEKYEQAEEKPAMMYILDSLGQLSTLKEVSDISEGNNTKDMTRTQLVRGAFRVLDLKLGKLKVPMIVTNHVYTQITTYGAPKTMSGGGGLVYACDQIAMLSKSKLRDDEKKVIGSKITVRMDKSRLTKEFSTVEVLLTYDKGLDRFYGLLDIAEKHGIVTKDGKKWKIGNQTADSRDEINENGETFYTKEVLDEIDAVCKKEFLYNQATV